MTDHSLGQAVPVMGVTINPETGRFRLRDYYTEPVPMILSCFCVGFSSGFTSPEFGHSTRPNIH